MRKKITEKQIELIKTLNEMGVSKQQICAVTGLSDKTVYRIITNQREQYLEYWRNRRSKLKEQEEQKKQDEAVQTVIETQTETQTETKTETVAQSNTISDEALYNVMKNAVLDAMNQALAQNMSNLRGMVLGAIRTSQM